MSEQTQPWQARSGRAIGNVLVFTGWTLISSLPLILVVLLYRSRWIKAALAVVIQLGSLPLAIWLGVRTYQYFDKNKVETPEHTTPTWFPFMPALFVGVAALLLVRTLFSHQMAAAFHWHFSQESDYDVP